MTFGVPGRCHGAMVFDAAIVMIENAHKHLERAEPGADRVEVLIKAAFPRFARFSASEVPWPVYAGVP